MIKVMIGEPLSPKTLYGPIEINKAIVSKKPKEIKNKKGKTMFDKRNVAYIFGKKFPISSYKKVASHANEAGSTSIIDVTDKTKSDIAAVTKTMDKNWPDFFFKKGRSRSKTRSRSPSARLTNAETKKIMSETTDTTVYFFGSTPGDTGADILIHKTNDVVDGIIIDTGCF